MAAVGLLGGTFDPVHLGHLAVARQCLVALGLDEVRLVPSNVPPHRPAPAAPAADRLAMAALAVEDQPGLSVDDLEVARGGRSYTVDTLRSLKQVVDGELWLLLGIDAALEFGTWRDAKEIARLARVAVFNRSGGAELSQDRLRAAGLPLSTRTVALDSPGVSGTEVRRRRAAGEPVDELLPASVLRYITERGLYPARP